MENALSSSEFPRLKTASQQNRTTKYNSVHKIMKVNKKIKSISEQCSTFNYSKFKYEKKKLIFYFFLNMYVCHCTIAKVNFWKHWNTSHSEKYKFNEIIRREFRSGPDRAGFKSWLHLLLIKFLKAGNHILTFSFPK